ncbi:hypothetical protein GCM10011387_04980 [Pedobacter quisquiliarum]|jgi:hypothetical protein|uniref:DUF4197 domain-containing protein n=1 Tax=Pedobacter quisquiliarum TaxID=1834438 RepID=A0A916U1E9_9SPHI|nr:DUF4197 domain-containing protein [Pedobacter quisquiliarum]GGC54451.1 hypothetical protein GCM10011387_04980 [Pedobacter quisquiliarum]
MTKSSLRNVVMLTIASCFLFISSCDVQSQAQLGNILKQAGATGTPTTLEIASGIKQALEIGTSNGADKLSAKDGFLGNMAVKILFPPEAQKVENALRGIGLGSVADNVITSLNRAAEDAAQEAKPIFIAAVRQMTITDATNILMGKQDAATEYFKRVTTAQLMSKFSPIIGNSLNKVGATKYWTEAANSYNKIPLVKPVTADLNAYVTQKAIDGMFKQVAQEELQIRENINARSTTLLKKVFGYADKNKK